MTQNQIQWHNAKENVRHNQVSEREQIRHNLRDESIRQQEIDETIRHQKQTESLTAQAQSEQVRHNFASESISSYQASTARLSATEQARHNVVQEAQGWLSTSALAGLNTAQAAKTSSEIGVADYSAQEQAKHWGKQDEIAFFGLSYDDSNAQSNKRSSEGALLRGQAAVTQSEAALKQADVAQQRANTDAAQGWMKLAMENAQYIADQPRRTSETVRNYASAVNNFSNALEGK